MTIASTPATTRNHYETLRVCPTASYQEIKQAFHALARQSHPDKQAQHHHVMEGSSLVTDHPSNAAGSTESLTSHSDSPSNKNNEKGSCEIPQLLKTQDHNFDFRTIQLAWETLRDETQRQAYDHTLQQQALKQTSKASGVLYVNRHALEQAVDEETGGVLYIHLCRCGAEVILGEADDGSNNDRVVDCQQCCFVYALET